MTEHNKAPTTGREMRYRVLADRMPPIPAEEMSEEQKKVASQIAITRAERGPPSSSAPSPNQ